MEKPKEKFDRIIKNLIIDVQQEKVLKVDMGHVLEDEGIDFYLSPSDIRRKYRSWLFGCLEAKQNPVRKYCLMNCGPDDWTFVEVCKTRFDGVVLRKYYNSVLYDSNDVGKNIRYVLTVPLLSHEGDRQSGSEICNINEFIE